MTDDKFKRRVLFLHRMLILSLFAVILVTSLTAITIYGKTSSSKLVYVVPVEQEIERGLQSFLERAFADAASYKADMIILEIDTLGGEIRAADQIGKLVRSEEIPVVAFIQNDAISAGAYISLNADQIIMAPGSRIGAAAPIDLSGNMADQKTFSFWVKSMEESAKLNNRNPEIAIGMVNPDVEIPGISKRGELVTLGASQALEHGYAEQVLATRGEVIEYLFGDQQVEIIEMEPSIGERIARFVTNPVVMPLLLLIGFIGVAVEIFSPGFGLPGIIGISSFSLFFFGHYFAGFANWEHIALFAIGIILLLIEIFIPGFGIFGAVGIGAMIAGIVLSAYNLKVGFISLGIALLISTIVIYILIKFFGFRGVWSRFVLKDEMTSSLGYVALKHRDDLLGKTGVSITPLRPSGNIRIGDELVDVVTEGGFIPSGVEVVVVTVEGSRIVVRKKE